MNWRTDMRTAPTGTEDIKLKKRLEPGAFLLTNQNKQTNKQILYYRRACVKFGVMTGICRNGISLFDQEHARRRQLIGMSLKLAEGDGPGNVFKITGAELFLDILEAEALNE
jgi:hypothetical protein